jgi:hypothetical protein
MTLEFANDFGHDPTVAYAGTKEQVKQRRQAFYRANRARLLADKKQSYDPIRRRAYAKRTYPNRREKTRRASREYYQRNREHLMQKSKLYRQRQAVKERRNENARNRRAADPQFALSNSLRRRMNIAIQRVGARRYKSLEELIGCTVDFLMGYIAAQFKEGMTWDNRRIWHIDHVRPCAKFDLRDPEQQKKCFHYSNLSPEWAIDNIRKAAHLRNELRQPQLL